MKEDDKFKKEKEELKETITKEGDELRKNMLDKLFNLNCILSAAFLVLYQFDKDSSYIKIMNLLPFCTVILILFYYLIQLRKLGFIYYKIDTWKNYTDLNSVELHNQKEFNVILISILLTAVELIYLFYEVLT